MLPKLPKLTGIAYRTNAQPIPRAGRSANLSAPVEGDPYAVYPPFMSRLEVAIWKYIEPLNPYWQLQVQNGRTGVLGSTRIDFMNPMLMIALHADGDYWHRYKTARDIYIRQLLAQRGLRNVVWNCNEPVETFVEKLPELYKATIA